MTTTKYFRKTEEAIKNAAVSEKLPADQLLKKFLMKAAQQKSPPPPPSPKSSPHWNRNLSLGLLSLGLVVLLYWLSSWWPLIHPQSPTTTSGSTIRTESISTTPIKRRNRPKRRHDLTVSTASGAELFKPFTFPTNVVQTLNRHGIHTWEELKTLNEQALRGRGLTDTEINTISRLIREQRR